MLDSTETIIDTQLIRPTKRRKADMTASLVIPQDEGKPEWQHYFAVWLVKDGYYKGVDNDGNTIIVQTRAAKDAMTGQKDSGPTNTKRRRPDLFIHIEGEDEQGEKVWDEILVAWKSRNGNFLTKNDEGHDIVIQPREVKEAAFKHRAPKRIAAIDLDADPNTDEAITEADSNAAEELVEESTDS
ncbi:hypothetical protein EYS14_13520 [Alteromonadaceae bacterium M269]|nr:hypothetical protein EYS14_13520 [Alteromonadaceae bacterium M269]